MTQINAYLTFNGNCREAMNFFKNCIGGELVIQTIEGSPLEAQCPASMKHSVLHSSLIKDGLVLMASEMIGPDGYQKGTNFALSLNCSSEEEINDFYEKLSAGGTILDSLKPQFWGSLFAAFNDKFGIRWMLIYDPKTNA